MAYREPYAPVAELRNRMDIEDGIDDAKIEQILEAISQAIDHATNRRFSTTASDETRYYTAEMSDLFLCPDDIVSVTNLYTDADGDRTYEDTWAATDYDLMPYNASLNNEPYTYIETTPQGDYSFPSMRKGVKIVGKFGWSSPPAPIREACLLLAEKLFKRKDLPFGIAGTTDLGTMITEIRRAVLSDAEIRLLIDPYIRRV